MKLLLSSGNEIEMVRTTQESDIFMGRDEITNTEYFLESWHAPLPTPDEIEQVEMEPGEVIELSPTAYEVERRRQLTQGIISHQPQA